MNRHLNWMDKSITWRGYLKLIAICAIVGTTISTVWCIVLIEPAWWKTTKEFVRRLFSK